MLRFTRLTIAILLLLVPTVGNLPAASQPARVRLVVVVVLDQFPEWILERVAPILPDDSGLRRLISEGIWYRNAFYPQATTVTAIGHSLLSTGAPPRFSGIYGNSWFDPAEGRTVYCVADPEFPLVGAAGQGASPRRLRVPTVGDVLATFSSGRAKVLSFSGKDRAAVLTAGYAGKAYWYSSQTGGFVSSRFYHRDGQLPEWLEATNKKLNASLYRGRRWQLLLPAGRYPAGADQRPGEPQGAAGQFPHELPDSDAVRSVLRITPFVNELTLRVAQEAVKAEQLGGDDTPDLLWLCLSATDTVGHAYGPLSLEYQDCLLRTGQALGEFFRFLDEKLGADGWAAALSADHGVVAAPEVAASVGYPAHRVVVQKVLKEVEREFFAGVVKQQEQAAGRPPRLIARITGAFLFLNPAAAEYAGLSRAAARARFISLLRRRSEVFAVYDATKLQEGVFDRTDPYARALYWALAPDWDADVAVVLRALSIPSTSARSTGSTHGSPHAYDANVPIVLRHPALRPAVIDHRSSVTQFAATLARWLNVPPPVPENPLPSARPAP